MSTPASPSGSDSLPQETPPHVPVLRAEVRSLLALRPGDLALDATVGAGGHTGDMLEAVAPGGRVLGLDADPSALSLARERLEPLAARLGAHLELIHANFRELPAVLAQRPALPPPRAILADLGVSSMQLERPERGFSFRFDAPLDLRMDPRLLQTGADLLRTLSEMEIADLIYQLGNEPGSRRIARYIVTVREEGNPVQTTGQLEALVRRALKVRGHRRIHPATRTFQALRMAVNRELEALGEFLEAAPPALAPGGSLALIAFHSGEDRMVKHRLKAWAETGRFHMVQKSVIRPGQDESRLNPRSRSARLRVLRREE